MTDEKNGDGPAHKGNRPRTPAPRPVEDTDGQPLYRENSSPADTAGEHPSDHGTDVTTNTTSSNLTHEERITSFRLTQGTLLVFVCIGLIFLLAVLSIFPWAQTSEVIPMALDTLKLITTTVVGFVFGSHTFSQRNGKT